MLEGPELARASKAGLHFIEDQQGVVGLAPLGQLVNVFDRREVRAHALERLEHHPRDVLRLQAFPGQRGQEAVEARVLGPIAVREGDLHDGRVFIDDPGFLAGNAAGLLRAERAPVKAALRADDADLLGCRLCGCHASGRA